MATNINRIILTGNLTVDPELRATANGTSVCHLRLACNTRRKDSATGEWGDRPNYFNVVVWGAQGENAARYLAKGRPVAVDGRLEWREWETQDGAKRQAVDVVADSIQFLGSPSEAPVSDAPFDPSDFAPLPVGQSPNDDPDIPF
jgi:single-strand DNA-binding protein